MVVLKALKFAYDVGLRRLEVELECKELVLMLNSDDMCLAPIGNLVEDILVFCQRFPCCSFVLLNPFVTRLLKLCVQSRCPPIFHRCGQKTALLVQSLMYSLIQFPNKAIVSYQKKKKKLSVLRTLVKVHLIFIKKKKKKDINKRTNFVTKLETKSISSNFQKERQMSRVL